VAGKKGFKIEFDGAQKIHELANLGTYYGCPEFQIYLNFQKKISLNSIEIEYAVPQFTKNSEIPKIEFWMQKAIRSPYSYIGCFKVVIFLKYFLKFLRIIIQWK
jgi:hypothetical protein